LGVSEYIYVLIDLNKYRYVILEVPLKTLSEENHGNFMPTRVNHSRVYSAITNNTSNATSTYTATINKMVSQFQIKYINEMIVTQ